MKRLKLFQILSLLLVATLCSCSKEDTPTQDEDKFYTVSLKFNGDITMADSPLTRGTSTDDLYGLLVWQDGSFFGSGLFDNVESMKVRLQSSKKYKFVVTAVKNGKNVLYGNSHPFGSSEHPLKLSNKLEGGNEHFYNYFRLGRSKMKDDEYYNYPETDRFYGEVDNYTPTENGVVNMDLKRTAFGLQYKVSGVSDGTVSITIENYEQTFFAKSDITTDYISEEKVITFEDVYSAWQYADNYTDKVTVSASWARGNGITQDLGSKEVDVKRNRMNIIHIKLATDESGNSLGIDAESDSDMDDESVTITY
ncbi:MAG: hypothetical protein IKM12_06275 [Alistipes sp.]|nr:hypothetical protein [Alistipes sp.]